MKKTLLYIALACATATSLQSCLDYDDPGAELGANQVTTSTDVHHGNADHIDFKRYISAETARMAKDGLSIELGQCRTGLYGMRGGKEGGVPASHAYQFQYNLETDNYAQYFVTTHKDFPYSNATITSTYNLSERFNGASHSGYGIAKNAFAPLLNHPLVDSIPEIKAIYLLYFDLIAQENADVSGPFTYTEDKSNSQDPKTYESLKSIYFNIKENLDTIVECLKYYNKRDNDYKAVIDEYLQSNDCDGFGMYNYGTTGVGNYIRLANSLKLRMAMHMVKVDPENAQKWAEEAVKSGVIEQVKHQQGVFASVIGFTHPLVEIANSWNDTRLSASFESLLMSLDHPLTKYLWNKNASPVGDIEANTRIVGIRSGTYVGNGQSVATNPFIAYSTFDSNVMAQAPLYFISLAEVDFLRAEGALRGWDMGGDAEYFYNEGIKNACLEDPNWSEQGFYEKEKTYAYYLEDYMNVESPRPYVQKDPLAPNTPWNSVTTIGVKWNNADSNETKLEKIITQKYIALFPDSHEAWTELRRTGYPKLFPVLNADDGDGTILQGEMIRRVPWASTDPQQQKYINDTGIPALSEGKDGTQEDFQATRLWWDVDAPNF